MGLWAKVPVMMTFAEELRHVLPKAIAPNHTLEVLEPADAREIVDDMFRRMRFTEDTRLAEWVTPTAADFLAKFAPAGESFVYVRKTDGAVRYITIVTREIPGSNYEARIALTIGGRTPGLGPVLYRGLWDIGVRRILSGFQQGTRLPEQLTAEGYAMRPRPTQGDFDVAWELKVRP